MNVTKLPIIIVRQMHKKTISTSDMDGISFRRIAGGSIIDNPPVFSENGE